MLILRFQKVGKKKDYTYRVVAVDSRFSSKSGKVKEVLGWWQPKTDQFSLNKERVNYWLKQGAQASDSCYNLLVKAKVVSGPKRPIKTKTKKTKEKQEESAPEQKEIKTEEKETEKTEKTEEKEKKESQG